MPPHPDSRSEDGGGGRGGGGGGGGMLPARHGAARPALVHPRSAQPPPHPGCSQPETNKQS